MRTYYDDTKEHPEPEWGGMILMVLTLPLFIVSAFVGFASCALIDGFLKGWLDYRRTCGGRPLGRP